MKKFIVKFSYRDRNKYGIHFKNSKRTVMAKDEQDAVRKIELSLNDKIILDNIQEHNN